MRKTRQQEFSIIVERDEEGYSVASVLALPGCHTQARSIDKLTERIREAIELVLEVDGANAKRIVPSVDRVTMGGNVTLGAEFARRFSEGDCNRFAVDI